MRNHLGLWEIAILAMLCEEPMHPYRMQSLIRERHKSEILTLKRSSLYHAINRLLRTHLIDAISNTRDGHRPERTTYRILPAGREKFLNSLMEMISIPRREPSDFLASMSFIVYLTPQAATEKLEERTSRLGKEIHSIEVGLRAAGAHVDRIHLLESEFLLAMRKAELRWVRLIINELRSGNLRWNFEEIVKQIRATQKASRAKVLRLGKEARI
jgi:DNA-binding PadR family transcriptional regulator